MSDSRLKCVSLNSRERCSIFPSACVVGVVNTIPARRAPEYALRLDTYDVMEIGGEIILSLSLKYVSKLINGPFISAL